MGYHFFCSLIKKSCVHVFVAVSAQVIDEWSSEEEERNQLNLQEELQLSGHHVVASLREPPSIQADQFDDIEEVDDIEEIGQNVMSEVTIDWSIGFCLYCCVQLQLFVTL